MAVKKKAVSRKKTTTKSKTVKSRNGRLVVPDDGDDRDDPEYEFSEIDDSELHSINFETMSKEDLLREVQKVDLELLRITKRMSEMTKKRNIVFKGDSEAINIKLRTLKQRSDLLFKCLNKIMPDKKSVEGLLQVNHSDIDSIPDSILAKIATGVATDEELEIYGHLLTNDSGTKSH